jgi:hypothetical protein
MVALKRFALAYLRNPAAALGLLLLIAIIAMALTADWFFPRDPLSLAGRPLQWPGANPRFPLGTDFAADWTSRDLHRCCHWHRDWRACRLLRRCGG